MVCPPAWSTTARTAGRQCRPRQDRSRAASADPVPATIHTRQGIRLRERAEATHVRRKCPFGGRHVSGSTGFVAARVPGLYGRRVRRSATLGAWSRRQTVLAGCLAAAAALAGLSVPFGVPWLAAAGAIVAAVAALAGLVIIAARARVEGW